MLENPKRDQAQEVPTDRRPRAAWGKSAKALRRPLGSRQLPVPASLVAREPIRPRSDRGGELLLVVPLEEEEIRKLHEGDVCLLRTG